MQDAVKDAISAVAEVEKAKKYNWDRLDVPVEHSGRAITLPGDPAKMPIAKAIEALQRKQAEEEQIVAVNEVIDAHPLDAAVALVKAMKNLYGWASPVPTPGFFGDQPPQFLSIKTGHRDEDVVQCPWGTFQLPGVTRPVNTTTTGTKKGPALVIFTQCKQKEKAILLELANETRRIVREESIYKGKAIRIDVGENGQLDIMNPPEFFDTSVVAESDLIFNDLLRAQIEDSILTPIRYPKDCQNHGVPQKRGILLEGPYGTGKTLVMAMVARVCEENDVTFILLNRVQGLRQALEFGTRFGRAVVAAEDIDRITEDRDEAANDLVNVIDGVLSKKSQIMTILTTNHVEKIAQVMLRPGRLDDVISLRAPDQPTVMKLLRHYAGKLLPEDVDLSAPAKELAGQIPASIRECVERAKLGMIRRRDNRLEARDISVAAYSMKNHLALLNRDTKTRSDAEVLAETLHKVVHNGTAEQLVAIKETVDDIYNTVN